MKEKSGGDGSLDTPYLITDQADLEKLRQCVNVGDPGSSISPHNHTNIHFKLTDDIILNEGEGWTPIGYYVSEASSGANNRPFNGTFDGKKDDDIGCWTISGLNVINTLPGSTANNRSLGLFGYVGRVVVDGTETARGTVQNLNVEGTVMRAGLTVDEFDATGIGGVVGRNEGTVQDCSFSGHVNKDYDKYNNSNYAGNVQAVGGVVGFNRGTVQRCSASGTVTGLQNVGGVVGRNTTNGKVSDCYNTGVITGLGEGTNSVNIGGVVGINNDGTVEKCYNNGNVTGTRGRIGGVVGSNQGSGDNTTSTVSQCYNTGVVSGRYDVGGVVGANFSNSGSPKLFVENCYNTGNVTRGANPDFDEASRGGVVGYNVGRVEYCYSYCTITGVYNAGGIVGRNVTSGGISGTVNNCVSLSWMVHGDGHPLVPGGAPRDIEPSVGTNVGRVVGLNNVTTGDPLAGNKARADMELRIGTPWENRTSEIYDEDGEINDLRHGDNVYTYFDNPNDPNYPSLQREVFKDKDGNVWSDSIWEFSEDHPRLSSDAKLPILKNLIELSLKTEEQNPRLPGHPRPRPPDESDDSSCGCDAGGFTAPGLLALAFMMGMKRLRNRPIARPQ